MTHHFYALTFDGFPLTRWRCAHCGLKVRTQAAKQLEGLPCR